MTDQLETSNCLQLALERSVALLDIAAQEAEDTSDRLIAVIAALSDAIKNARTYAETIDASLK